MPERIVPRQDMELVRIDQRPVEIENNAANHAFAFVSFSSSGNGGGFAATAAGR
jgi:hypothetical protein